MNGNRDTTGFEITHRMLYEAIRNNTTTRCNLKDYVLALPYVSIMSKPTKKEIEKQISTFLCQFRKRWNESGRKSTRFEEKFAVWLQGKLKLPCKDSKAAGNRGRPDRNFSECTERSKLRKVSNLLSSTSQEELVYAAKVSLNLSGKRDAATILKEVSQTTPSRANKVKKAFFSAKQVPVPYSPEKALALFVNANLTKRSYRTIRKHAKEQGCNIYPSYDTLFKAKQDCYPSVDNIMITEYSAEVKLQALLDHTVKRLAIFQKDVLEQCVFPNDQLTIVYKWGCDGSSGQKEYKQTFSEDGISDANLFIVSIVPLQLHSESDKVKKIVWQNPVPSSTRFCRPIRFVMKAESIELTKKEVSTVENQIAQLRPTEILFSNQRKYVNHKLLLTMVDGKVCSSLNGISAQRCLICGATPKEMNLPHPPRSVDESKLSFGLSTLHCYIRFFECILHIAYRLDIKKWQARSAEEKESVKGRKTKLTARFRTEMGLLVDQPKQNTGNTNDGNTARRFFKDAEKSSDITGIDCDLIKRFSTILNAMSSNLPIDTKKFQEYAEDTRKLYLSLYSWYNMPSTVHKVLVHGAAVIQNFLLPIGQLSEEAQETRNKDYRKFREHHTRKDSRLHTNVDLLHMLLITSDPVISQVLQPSKKKCAQLNSDVLRLLKGSDYPENSNSDCSRADSDSFSESDEDDN